MLKNFDPHLGTKFFIRNALTGFYLFHGLLILILKILYDVLYTNIPCNISTQLIPVLGSLSHTFDMHA